MESEGSLPHSKAPANCPYTEPARSSPYPHTPLPEDQCFHYHLIYDWFFQVVSFLYLPSPKACIHLYSPHMCYMPRLPCLNWDTQFLTMVYDGAYSSNVSFRMAWISFCALSCREKRTWWQLVSRCCWNRARRLTFFVSVSVTRKDLQFGTWTDPSFQRHYRFRPTKTGSRSG